MDEEAPAIIADHRPPTSWPHLGTIDYLAYSVRYRPSLPLVLREVTCHIRANEKVGIVGRTGCGKLIGSVGEERKRRVVRNIGRLDEIIGLH